MTNSYYLDNLYKFFNNKNIYNTTYILLNIKLFLDYDDKFKIQEINNILYNKLKKSIYYNIKIENNILNNNSLNLFNSVIHNNIISIDLSNSNINEFLLDLPNLKYLNCSNTLINNINTNYNNLEILNINNTKIIEISKNYIQLKELHASGSLIKKLSKKYTLLNKLYINNTNINKIKYYPNLEYLECQYTVVSKIIFDHSYYKNNKLQYLLCNNTLINNYIAEPHILFSKYNIKIYQFTNLLYLDCSHTNIEHIPANIPNLKYLNISNTLISYFPNRMLLNLEILICNNSELKILNKNLTKLYMLDISNNCHITKIPNTYTQLEYLILDYTDNIKKISKKLKNLKYLSCKGSYIQELPITLHNLYFLNIMDTNIYMRNQDIHYYYY